MPDQPVSPPTADNAGPAREPPPRGETFPVVGVGGSAGGLEAFTQLLRHLPLDTGMGFVIVAHLDPEHESALADILSRATSLPVTAITDGQRVAPDHVYVIPPDAGLSIERGILKLRPRPEIRAPHRPIDTFFESLSRDRSGLAVGVVLSGTGNDGTLGLEAIKAEGGLTFAQDDSAKHESMPRSAVAAGCVDLVLPPADVAAELGRIAKHPHIAGQATGAPWGRHPHRAEEPDEQAGEAGAREDATLAADEAGADARAAATAHEHDDTPLPSGGPPRAGRPAAKEAVGEEPGGKADRKPSRKTRRDERAKAGPTAEDAYRKILMLLHGHSGVDFSLYKSNTVRRRISRRMVLTKHVTPADYAAFLRGNSDELDALYSDVLISVTSFFRNPESFDALRREVLPELLRRGGDDPLRCWVLGCSTGQEAYSIAMSFVEAADEAPRASALQIFATDLNDALLEKARRGLYAKTLADDVTPERLRRFFVEEDGGYRVTKALRDMVVFARQNFISDPPFSRMDLISCRNLLIYLEPGLQQKALPTFHFALRPGGFLLLGASESTGRFTELFEVVDKKHKIFARKAAATPSFHLSLTGGRGGHVHTGRAAVPLLPSARSEPPDSLRTELDAQREADRVTVSRFGPAGVVVNAELQVLQFRGPTGGFLQPPSGKASFDVLKMARGGLMLPLRATINQARTENKPARRENVPFERYGKTASVDLEVIPLKSLREPCWLILFEETGGTGRGAAGEPAAAPPLPKKQEKNRVADLETELAETRDYLQSMQEQYEAANEELQAANEEAQSANEELQSMNEELETSKEEIESANEELSTVNDEMNNRNLELNRANNDLLNRETSTKLTILLLGPDLTIRRFSPQAGAQLRLKDTDVGRPVGNVPFGLTRSSGADVSPPDAEGARVLPEAVAAEVLADLHEQEHEVRDEAGRWHLMRVRPYLTLDNKVDGVVVVLTDIDALKRSEQAAMAARDYAESVVATVREPLLVLDGDLRVESANEAFYRTFRVTRERTVGRLLYELGNHQWDIPRLRELLGAVLLRRATVEAFEVEHDFETIGTRVVLLNARRLVDPAAAGTRILLAIQDVTERRRAEESVRVSTSELHTHVEELSRFNDAAVGRELRMVELKKEINALLERHGEPARYRVPVEHEERRDAARDPSSPREQIEVSEED